MPAICYHASHEQFPPSYLLDLVIKAERAGFDGIHSSEHFNPWSARQGHSGFAFSWIGAAMQATRLPFSMVCAPGPRHHPAIIAQAVATLAEMFPGRFNIELGSGEALNENITGQQWPDKTMRNERLWEATEVIRRLLKGEEVSWEGYFKVKEAKLYTLPVNLPMLFCAALSAQTAQWAGSWSDGLLTSVGEIPELENKINAYRENGGQHKPVYLQYAFSYARSREEALMGAWDQWRSNLLSPYHLANLYKPEQFDELSKNISPEVVGNAVPVFTSMDKLLETVATLKAVNPSRIILHNVNRLQDQFIEDYKVARK